MRSLLFNVFMGALLFVGFALAMFSPFVLGFSFLATVVALIRGDMQGALEGVLVCVSAIVAFGLGALLAKVYTHIEKRETETAEAANDLPYGTRILSVAIHPVEPSAGAVHSAQSIYHVQEPAHASKTMPSVDHAPPAQQGSATDSATPHQSAAFARELPITPKSGPNNTESNAEASGQAQKARARMTLDDTANPGVERVYKGESSSEQN